MANNTFKEIAEVLLKAEKILIYPHINADGDGVGSAAALCHTLRRLGKTAYVLVEDELPSNLRFMDKGYFTFDDKVIEHPDVSVCVDCGDFGRLPKRKEKFLSAETTLCVDHHGTTQNFCDYNYVDPSAAATGELIYAIIKELVPEVDVETGEAIFTAITTDTGNFQYSNTTKECHEITAELYEKGVDVRRVSQQVYESVRLERVMLHGKALSQLEIFAGGQAAMTVVTQRMLRETGAGMDETEGIVDKLRAIDGVEIAILVKEDVDKIKLSLRAKSRANVAVIAEHLGGGGHTKAAGGTMKMTLEEALPLIRQEVENALL